MRPAKKIAYSGLGLLFFALVLLTSSAVCLATPTFNRPVNSDGGQVANAISLSAQTFSGGVSAVVVTSVNSYADSLAAAVLAKAYSGPLLLTSSSALTADVASELTRLKPAKVFLVGLPSSFVSSVKAAVSGLSSESVIVIKGTDRYETAALVANAVKSKLGTVAKVVIAPGDSYGAALAASSLAAAQGWPLLLTPAAGPFPQSAKDAIADLGVSSGVVVGTSVTLGVSGFTVNKRIIGTTSTGDPDGRYDACAKLAVYAVAQGWLSYAHLGLVPGNDYPDGEATVAFLARDKGVLLFSQSSILAAATSAAIKDHGSQIQKVDFVGLGWPVYREVKSLGSARVTGLSATNGPVGGGNKLVVTGTALTGATKVRVGKVDVPSSHWKVDSSTQLTISSVPAAHGDGPVEVTVFNFWGASPAATSDLYWYGGDGVLSPGEKVVQKAVQYLGVPYLWAGASPTAGFDCSGFCMYVYKQFGVSLPHYSGSMATYGTAVSKDDLQPGDLVFFYTPISHVGMYVGGGMMINAPRSGDLVTIEDAFRSGYVTARRMLSPYTRYEQTDSALAYTGTWSKSTTSSASGGSFFYANAAGDSATISFSGTYLAWIQKKSPVYGIAKVTLDDKTPVMVDLYSSSTVYQQKVWNSGTLTAGNHTVKIEWTGTKNASATDTNIGLDALDLIGNLTKATSTPPLPAPTGVRYEQTDSHVVYAGTWHTFSTTGPCGGTYLRANTSGASATISFNGTYLAWIATKGKTLSKAKVSLDGGAPVTIDLAAPAVAYQQKVWDTGTLPEGSHTVTICWDPANATGKYISVDAVDVIGTLTHVSTTPPAPTTPQKPTTTRYEQTDGHFAYAGGWTTSSASTASAGNFYYANSAGSSMTVAFDGTYLAWIAKKGPVYGRATVTVDGGTPVTVDLYSAATLWQEKAWDTGTLAAGSHTVRIEWTGTRNSSATDTNISVDAFEMAGTLSQASSDPLPPPVPTRYEETDAHFVYAGTWYRFPNPDSSGGSYLRANTSGASATISFDGTYLAWIATVGTTLSKAQVSLDGGAPVTIDLAAPVVLRQQKVWETGTLSEGLHTVTISWNPTNAAGKYISVDAVEAIGTLVTASSTTPVSLAPDPVTTRYEQTDTHLTFGGGWIASSSSEASSNSFRFTDSPGAYALATFDGSFLAWIGKKSPAYGTAKVTLDGGTPQTVDLSDVDTKWQQRLWDTGLLPRGTHTVKIEWTGIKSPSAIDANINVDAFDVAGTLTQASVATPGRYEQDDQHLVYAGNWTTSTSSPASAGSFRFANSTGSSVTVTFVGSSLAWIAKKSPVYGKARVTLDRENPVIVDLYDGNVLWNQKVWGTGAVVPGTHTVKIEWTGTKSSAATAANISVDAFEINGALK